MGTSRPLASSAPTQLAEAVVLVDGYLNALPQLSHCLCHGHLLSGLRRRRRRFQTLVNPLLPEPEFPTTTHTGRSQPVLGDFAIDSLPPYLGMSCGLSY